jgi:hypothetical protein
MTQIPWVLVFYGIALLLILIGIIVAWNIKSYDSDKKAGDKRLVAAIFVLSGVIFFTIGWVRKSCPTPSLFSSEMWKNPFKSIPSAYY